MRQISYENSWPKFTQAQQGQLASSIECGEGKFRRIEDKFIINGDKLERALEVIGNYMSPQQVNDEMFTLIESLYFDGPHFEFFQHHCQKLRTRFKFRIRRYAPDGVWDNDQALVEIKKKEEGVTKKSRIVVDAANLLKMKEGGHLQMGRELKQLNSKLSHQKLEKRIRKINQMISRYQLTPAFRIRYKRYAFQRDNFRLTIDKNLTMINCRDVSKDIAEYMQEKPYWSEAQSIPSKFNNADNIILEIKHSGVVPDWVEEMSSHAHVKKASFSKYCWSVVQQLKTLMS